MTVTEDFVVRGRADVGNATQGLSRMQGAVVTLNQALELGAKAVRAFNAVITDTARLALEQERVFANMRNRLSAVGIAYEDVSGQLSEFFAQMQATSRFGDDAMAATIARLATATRELEPTIDQLQAWSVTVADFAEANQTSLEAASRIVAKAVAGDVEALGRYLPAYKDVLRELARVPDAAERGAQALEILQLEFGGAAQSLNGFDLALARVENGMGDFREAIGDTVIQSEGATLAMGTLASQVDALAAAFTAGEDGPTAMGAAIEALTVTSIDAMSSALEFALEAFVRLRQATIAIEGSLTDGQGGRFAERAQQARALAAGGGSPGDVRGVVRGLRAGNQNTLAAQIGGSSSIAAGFPTAEEVRLLQQAAREFDAVAGARQESGDELLREFAQIEAEWQEVQAQIRARAAGSGPERGGGAPTGAANTNTEDGNLEEVPGLWERANDALTEYLTTSEAVADIIDQIAAKEQSALEFSIMAAEAKAEAAEKERLEKEYASEIRQREIEVLEEHALKLEEQRQARIDTFLDPAVNQGVNALSTSMANLGSALGSTQDNSEKAGKVFLKTIGQMAAGVGAMYLAMAPPMLIPGPGFNPAKGIALLAGGGLLVGLGAALGAAGSQGGGRGGRAAGANTANLEETGSATTPTATSPPSIGRPS